MFSATPLPPCLLEVMRTAVMVPSGSHIWPSVSVTASSFIYFLIYFFYPELLYNLQIVERLRGEEQRCTSTVSVAAVSPFILVSRRKIQLFDSLPLPLSSLSISRTEAVRLGTGAHT